MHSLADHFLIAMPAMGDPNFNETVTYVCKHDDAGALGLVVNRPIDMSLGAVLAQLKLETADGEMAARPVVRGGPVEPERGFVLHRSAQPLETTIDTGGEIRVTMSPDVLDALARGELEGPALVALGYAGWAPGQLEAELGANAWLSVLADSAIVFSTPFAERWSAAVGLFGVDIHQIASYAGHA